MTTAIKAPLRCPHCKRFYATLADLKREGGRLYQLGISLKATCGRCGGTWRVTDNITIKGVAR